MASPPWKAKTVVILLQAAGGRPIMCSRLPTAQAQNTVPRIFVFLEHTKPMKT